MSEKTLWDHFLETIGNPTLKIADEIQRLIPDSLLFGALLLFILTRNQVFGIFSLFLVETSILHKIIVFAVERFGGTQTPVRKLQCRPGLRNPSYDYTKLFSSDKYPSLSIYSITAIATYIGLAMNYFKETLQEMGVEWETRQSVAFVFTVGLLIFFVGMRIIRGCETKGEIVLASIFGLIVGALFYMMNKSMFGPEGINFLGLPVLVDKSKEGSPIYVCTPKNVSTD